MRYGSFFIVYYTIYYMLDIGKISYGARLAIVVLHACSVSVTINEQTNGITEDLFGRQLRQRRRNRPELLTLGINDEQRRNGW